MAVSESKNNNTNVTNIWSTEKINEILRIYERTGIIVKNNPFYQNEIDKLREKVLFEYTKEEALELARCSEDIVYFAEKYCKVLTDSGLRTVKLRPYQKKILLQLKRYLKNILLQSRQSGKSITTGIFIVWFLLFHNDKNVVIASATGDKAKEFADKIDEILKGLPYFMKLGLITDNILTKAFDNGSKLFVQTTTENTGAGITCHLMILDEFALVHRNILNAMYKTVLPTLSSSKTARLVIMSTPRGTNKFYEIWNRAINGKNNYNPIRVDWWEVPLQDEDGNALKDENGNIIFRGEDWKAEQIADLGNEEDFNQEFGNQFLAGNSLLFNSDSLRKIKRFETEFKHHNFDELDDLMLDYSGLKFHQDFNLENLKDEKSRFIISVDLAEGVGGDYTVFNIFKLLPMTKKEIGNVKVFSSVKDFFKLVEIGKFRSNVIDIPTVSKIFYHIIVDLMIPENVKVILELNYEGNYFKTTVLNQYQEQNELDEDALFMIFPYNMIWENAKTFKSGIQQNNEIKSTGCKVLKDKVKYNQIVICCKNSVEQCTTFAKNKAGTYESQLDHDDDIMTVVNVIHVFQSPYFEDMCEEYLDFVNINFTKDVEKKMNKKLVNNEKEDSGVEDFLDF